MLDEVFDEDSHRKLAEEMLRSASEANGVDVGDIDFVRGIDKEAPYAWLCYVADPVSSSHVAALTATSAADHFKRYDPNGFVSENARKQVSASVHELETSSEAPCVLLGSGGEDIVFSPWMHDLVVVRATFTYVPA